MPKRSNDFQKLITFIETQLAPENATITESAMVMPLDGGELREVDVLIEAPVGNHNLSIAVECRDHKRKQSVTWIEQIEGKYRFLPIDQVIAVSRSGFTKGAEKRAKNSKITTLTLEEALVLDWPEKFTRWAMGLVLWHHPLVSARVTYHSDNPPDLSDETLKKSKITNAEGSLDSILEQEVLHLFQEYASSSVQEWANENFIELWNAGEGKKWDVDIRYKAHNIYLIDPEGKKHQIREVMLVLKCHFEVQHISPRYYTYNKARLALGNIDPEVGQHQYTFKLLINEDGIPQAINIRQIPKPKGVRSNTDDA